MSDTAFLMASLEAGKKIRGGLTCLVSEALGGTLESAVPRAISVEMIQVATLIHDDFVDQDTVRRGRPATWTVEGARRAVLIGDVIFASAIKMMSDLGREDGATVSDAIAQVSRGALHEPLDPLALAGEIESGRVNGRLYQKVIRLKTGILFGAACRLGAIAAGADDKLKDASYPVRITHWRSLSDSRRRSGSEGTSVEPDRPSATDGGSGARASPLCQRDAPIHPGLIEGKIYGLEPSCIGILQYCRGNYGT